MANQSKNQVDMLSFDSDDSDNHKAVILNIFRKGAKKDLKKNPDFTPTAEAFGFSIKQNDHLKYEILPDNNSIVLIKYF